MLIGAEKRDRLLTDVCPGLFNCVDNFSKFVSALVNLKRCLLPLKCLLTVQVGAGVICDENCAVIFYGVMLFLQEV